MIEKRTPDNFDEELISEFVKWSYEIEGMPHWDENKKAGMKKFNLSAEEYSKLLYDTVEYWLF